MFLSASEGLYVYLPIADMRVVFTRRLRSETPWNDSVPIDLPGIPGSSPTTAGFVMSFMSTTSVGCAAMLLPTYRQSRTAVMPPFAPRGRLNLGSSSGLVATRVKFFIWPPDGILSIGVRGWTPLYDSGAGDEQAATIKIASGTREPQRANLFIDPPCRPRGREAGPSAADASGGSSAVSSPRTRPQRTRRLERPEKPEEEPSVDERQRRRRRGKIRGERRRDREVARPAAQHRRPHVAAEHRRPDRRRQRACSQEREGGEERAAVQRGDASHELVRHQDRERHVRGELDRTEERVARGRHRAGGGRADGERDERGVRGRRARARGPDDSEEQRERDDKRARHHRGRRLGPSPDRARERGSGELRRRRRKEERAQRQRGSEPPDRDRDRDEHEIRRDDRDEDPRPAQPAERGDRRLRTDREHEHRERRIGEAAQIRRWEGAPGGRARAPRLERGPAPSSRARGSSPDDRRARGSPRSRRAACRSHLGAGSGDRSPASRRTSTSSAAGRDPTPPARAATAARSSRAAGTRPLTRRPPGGGARRTGPPPFRAPPRAART